MAGKGTAEGCCPSCAKWLLIIFNVLFNIVGILLIALGVYAYVQMSDYLDIVGNANINAPAIVLIAFGCITALIAAIGWIGACKENACLLFTFAVVIGILLIAEIAAGIAAFVFKGDVVEKIDQAALDSIDKYKQAQATGDKSAVTDGWDKLQKEFECCGWNAPEDWGILPAERPLSCGASLEGCKPRLVGLIENNLGIVGGIGVGLGVVQLLGIVLACIVGCNVRKSE